MLKYQQSHFNHIKIWANSAEILKSKYIYIYVPIMWNETFQNHKNYIFGSHFLSLIFLMQFIVCIYLYVFNAFLFIPILIYDNAIYPSQSNFQMNVNVECTIKIIPSGSVHALI